MMVTDKEYADHRVFSELERYINFYESLGWSVFGFCSMGTGAACNIDSGLYSSIQGTLESIHNILKGGRINDAYALLRKYYDSAIINVYSILYLGDHFSIENFIVEEINNWLKGKENLPGYGVMRKYIQSSAKVAAITRLVLVDDRYKRIRVRCNEHTHYKFYYHVLLNDHRIYLANRGQVLETFAADARDVFILHLAYLFFLCDVYMMSSDYVDFLDCGMTPEPDSQYWVAPFVQQVFDDVLVKHRPDIAATIKQRTKMHLS